MQHTIKKISEDMNLQSEWYELAKKQTLASLPAFVSGLANDYEHDFGTIIHAVAASALAASHAVNNSETGDLDPIQGGAVMAEFVKNWLGLKAPFRVVNYEDFLYPQYAYRHKKKISPQVWEWLQSEAQNQLENKCTYLEAAYENHWRSILRGEVPFGYKVSKK
jgi:hypothetical protein